MPANAFEDATNSELLEIARTVLEVMAERAVSAAELVTAENVPREAVFEAHLFVTKADHMRPWWRHDDEWMQDVSWDITSARERVGEAVENAMRAAIDA